MNELDILNVPVLNDNYVYLLHDPASGATACVDPAAAPPVIRAVKDRGWSISHILITHPHSDHTDGVVQIVSEFAAEVYGSHADMNEIPHCTHGVKQGERIDVGTFQAEVFDVPGHTAHHVAYYFADAQALFCGDTLFSLGCGRLFDATAQHMWSSLKKLRSLPPQTRVYGAHEYTAANAEFALSVDPENVDLKARATEVLRLREAGQPSVPSTLESEAACNPFLRCDIPAFKAQLGLQGVEADQVFAELRHQKDRF